MAGVDTWGRVRWCFTDRGHGDLCIDADPGPLDRRRQAVVAAPWTWLHQAHGAEVIEVRSPGHLAGSVADAAVTDVAGAAVSVQVADCAPVLLVGDDAVGVVHAGWRGLVAGVVEAAAQAMTALGSPPVAAVLGPCIRPRCYEFGRRELDQVAQAYGDVVRAETAWGTPALDLPAGVAAACSGLGLALADAGTCTACSARHHSHRARRDVARQALVAWLEP